MEEFSFSLFSLSQRCVPLKTDIISATFWRDINKSAWYGIANQPTLISVLIHTNWQIWIGIILLKSDVFCDSDFPDFGEIIRLIYWIPYSTPREIWGNTQSDIWLCQWNMDIYTQGDKKWLLVAPHQFRTNLVLKLITKKNISRTSWIWELRLMNCRAVVEIVFGCEKGTRKGNTHYWADLLSRKETISPFPIVKRIFWGLSLNPQPNLIETSLSHLQKDPYK